MAGGTALTVSLVSGTASAHRSKFFGCERVSTGTDGDFAVVSVDGGYECREMENEGPLEDVPWNWDAHSYVATEGEAVVGFMAENEVRGDDRANEGCWLCVNPNACAEDRYDSAEQIREELDNMTCGPCGSDVNISVGCEPAAEPGDDETGSEPGDESGATDDATDSPDEFQGLVRQLEHLFRQVGFEFRR
ncbi:hypothetical protein ACFQL4_25780 [Halosimplex aquaticum]